MFENENTNVTKKAICYAPTRQDSTNHEGYSDPTPYEDNAHMWEEKRFHDLLKHIFYMCNMAGFQLEGRITLVDRRTGRRWE